MTGSLVTALYVPHPPLIIPAVGGSHLSRVDATIRAFQQAVEHLKRNSPDSVVVLSPHGPAGPRGELVVRAWETMEGDMSAFGAPGTGVSFSGDEGLARGIRQAFNEAGLRSSPDPDPSALDHGTVVPLWYVKEAGLHPRLVVVSGFALDRRDLLEAGRSIRVAINRSGSRVALVVSGDLSHRLERGAPAGYAPEGKVFDHLIYRLLAEGSGEEIARLDPDLVDMAAECGYRPLLILLGALEEGWKADLLSYEGPFGVGYLVGVLEPDEPPGESYPELARQSLKEYLETGQTPPQPERIPQHLRRQAGAFVSIKKAGELRGCIGTLRPTRPTLASEIIVNAIRAGTADPRFRPLTPEELDQVSFSVDVLGPPETVTSLDDLDPGRYGILVEKGRRSGLLLPDLEGVDKASQQLEIACHKAGISPEDPGIIVSRFRVERYNEKDQEVDG